MVKYSPILQEIVNTLMESANDDGVSEITVEDDMFRNWEPYTGLQLETDWKTKIKREGVILATAMAGYRAAILFNLQNRK